MARGKHLFPFRTEQLSPSAPMVLGLHGPGRVGRRRFIFTSRPSGRLVVVPACGARSLRSDVDDRILLGDNLELLAQLPDAAFQLVYADPPFNTGSTQTRRALETVAAADGDRVGFGGRRYRTRLLAESSYRDHFDDYLAFLAPRLEQVRRVMTRSGTLYFHIDYREAHYCKLLLDEIF